MNETPDPQKGSALPAGLTGESALADLVEQGPFGLVITDAHGVIHWINATLAESLGIAAQELIGQRTFQSLLTVGGRIYYDTHVRPMLHMDAEVREIAFELVRSDGSRWPVLVNTRVRDGSTADDHVIDTVVFDATHRRSYEAELLQERRLAEQAEARLQVMYDVASGMAAAITTDEIVAVVNKQGSESLSGARCAVWLFEDQARSIVQLGAINEDSGTRRALPVPDQAPALDLLAAGELVIIPDRDEAVNRYPILCEWMATAATHSAVIAPLHFRGSLRGAISYGFSERQDFDAGELAAVAALVTQTEQAMRRAELVESDIRSKRRLEDLLEFTSRLSGALTLDDVIDTVADGGRKLLQAVAVRVALIDETRQYADFVRSLGVNERLGSRISLDRQSIGCAAMRTGKVQVVADRQELLERFPDSPILSDPISGRVISVPLLRGDEILGAWVLAFEDAGGLAPEDVALVEMFAAQAGQVMQRAAIHDAENLARSQAELRWAMSEALNRAVTTSDVAAAITHEGLNALDAAGLAVYVTDPDNTMQLLAESQRTVGGAAIAGTASTDDVRAIAQLTDWTSPRFVVEGDEVDVALGGIVRDSGWRAVAIMPLGLSGLELGLIIVGFDGADTLSSSAQVALAGLSAEASVALGRARRFEMNHDIAITLQQSMSPELAPLSPGWTVTTCYEPGSDQLLVGGDMFDVTELDDGRIVVVVGDVVGHGLEAAAAMGSLRAAAKVLALVKSGPAELLNGLQSFAATTPGVLCSSICCVELDPDGHGRYASAGHPYPVLRNPDGSAELLTGGRSPLLGVSRSPTTEAALFMAEGSTLVMVTDGLIDRRETASDQELERLRRYVSEASFPETGARHVVEHMLGDLPREDDIVVLCLSRTGSAPEV